MKFDSVIFDVDGTIWDSTPVVEMAWNAALESVGVFDVKVSAKQLKGLFGLPMEDIIFNIIPNESAATRKEFQAICSRYEFEYIERQPGILYKQMEELLKQLSDKCPLFVVSNCQAGYIELLFRKTGFDKYFKEHLCPGDTGLLKCDNIKRIVERYKLQSPVYVGDTQMDADACEKAGVPIIYASYGFGKIDKPYATVQEPIEILKFLV